MKLLLQLSFLCLVSLSSEVLAWSPNSLSTSSRSFRRHTTAPSNRSSGPSPTASTSNTQIQLKFIESSDEDNAPKIILSAEEDKAVRAVAKTLSSDDAYGVGWFDRDEAWEAAKTDYPILQQYDNADLKDAYLKQKPNVLEIFTDTPLGPFLLINLIAKFSGFTWCDTPFGQASACLPH